MAEREQKAIIQRLTEQMDKDNLDALILTSGDAVFYATGYASRDLYKNGQTGGTVAVVTKNGRAGIVVSEFARRTAEMAVDGVEIISYPTWIYIEDYAIEGMDMTVCFISIQKRCQQRWLQRTVCSHIIRLAHCTRLKRTISDYWMIKEN